MCWLLMVLLFVTPRPPPSPLFPYTTLFRSGPGALAPGPSRAVPHPPRGGRRPLQRGRGGGPHRSEEHTSELQSHVNLVCRLLLEKKKSTFQIPSSLFPASQNTISGSLTLVS